MPESKGEESHERSNLQYRTEQSKNHTPKPSSVDEAGWRSPFPDGQDDRHGSGDEVERPEETQEDRHPPSQYDDLRPHRPPVHQFRHLGDIQARRAQMPAGQGYIAKSAQKPATAVAGDGRTLFRVEITDRLPIQRAFPAEGRGHLRWLGEGGKDARCQLTTTGGANQYVFPLPCSRGIQSQAAFGANQAGASNHRNRFVCRGQFVIHYAPNRRASARKAARAADL